MRLLIEHLSKVYPSAGKPVTVLEEVNLALESYQTAAVVGPSGSGKSTLLHLIAGLESADGGRIVVGDQALDATDRSALDQWRRRQVGVMFQDHFLLGQCSALQNVLVPRLAVGGVDDNVMAFAVDLLDRLGLSDRSDHLPGELSVGQRQRVALARALISRPHWLLADEPTGALDRQTGGRLMDLLLAMAEDVGFGVLVVTHDPVVACRMTMRYELANGRLERC